MVKAIPPPPVTSGNRGEMKFPPDDAVRKFTVINEVKHITKQDPEFCMYIQELKFDDDDVEELRFCYYKIGKRKKGYGKWLWGQSCPSGLKADFRTLIRKAQKAGFL